jgi:hypothetical protein
MPLGSCQLANIDRGIAVLDAEIRTSKFNVPSFPRVWIDHANIATCSDYLIKGVLDKGALALIWGETGKGKTFFALDMAAHVAAGIPWRGMRVKPGLVVYVAAEGGAGILGRFQAWRESHADLKGIPLAIILRSANLLSKDEISTFLLKLKEIVTEANRPLALVVFDTLNRSMLGGDENSSQTMTQLIAAADVLRCEFGASTIFVHHAGKALSKGPRGHSSLVPAVDTEIMVSKHQAKLLKSRDGPIGATWPFKLLVVGIGIDGDGETRTTCTIQHLTSSTFEEKENKLTKSAQLALTTLCEMTQELLQQAPESSTTPSGESSIHVDQWFAAFKVCYEKNGSGNQRSPTAIKMAFSRARNELLGTGKIRISNSLAYVTR